tara:strand:- start:505 stop:714 length:210 start_codon:yes stop_codon:yes gene_type:complete
VVFLFSVVVVVAMLLVKTNGPSLILVDHPIPILVHVLPVVLLAGTCEKAENQTQQTYAFHLPYRYRLPG